MQRFIRQSLVLAWVVSHSLVALAAPTVTFVSAPTVVPRNTSAPDYSPLLSIQYAGLNAETYTLKVYLLETQTGNYNCGCDATDQMWCGATFMIDNQSGAKASGAIVDARMTNIHDRSGFLWVADLYNHLGAKIFTVTQIVTASLNRAPVLTPIGNRSGTVGQNLDFSVTASDAENDTVSLTAQNLPPGATFNGATGQFHWQPSSPGTSSGIAFIVTQTGGTPLSDAELITIQVGNQPTSIITFSKATYATGESGPAVVTATRTNANAGAASVMYSTVDGSALAGSDYTATSGTLAFATGEATKTIRISTINDTNVETNETFNVELGNPTGATLGDPSIATVTIVDDDTPALAGQWASVIPLLTVPIHMQMLPTGKIMFWDRHNDSVTPMWDGTPYLWDVAAPASFTALPSLQGWDLFCSGHTFLPDGRLLVAGGHIADQVGSLKAGIYDPFANSWMALPEMNAGRWYPTNTTLANGDVLVVAGTRNGYGDINPLPQVLQVDSGTWRNLTSALMGGLPTWADYYPYMYQAPNGKVFVAGPQQIARYLDTAGNGSWSDVANSSLAYRDYGTSVMYANGKVLIAGGNPREPDLTATPTIIPSSSAEVIDLNVGTPAWRSVEPMSVGRRHANTTILPDGTILMTGGSSAPGFDEPAGAVHFAELWNPATETWTPLAGHSRYRGYHSNALLLADGRVVVAGGGHPDPAGGVAENNAEIFSPPYLFKGPRPAITAAPVVVTYGQTFSVQTPDAMGIANVNWIRLSAVTHAFNQNQRINQLAFTPAANILSVTAPPNANVCPPGHYMLFILNGNGVPSVAKIVEITLSSLRIDSVTPATGRTSGGQQIKLTGAFAGLSSVKLGGAAATWSFSIGTSEITVTTPDHAIEASQIAVMPASGSQFTKAAAFAFLPTAFTDNTLTVGSTLVRAVHVIELRQAIDVLRSVAGLAPSQWTDLLVTSMSTPIKAAHIAELRARLEEAAAVLGYSASQYTDPSLTAGTVIKQVHVEELRQRIRTIGG